MTKIYLRSFAKNTSVWMFQFLLHLWEQLDALNKLGYNEPKFYILKSQMDSLLQVFSQSYRTNFEGHVEFITTELDCWIKGFTKYWRLYVCVC